MTRNLFKLDLRSLALARIFLGILAIYDITRRLPDLNDFFTDAGMLPRWILLDSIQPNWKMSLLYLNGSYTWALMVAIAGLLAAVAFTVGWRSRIANAVLWIVIVSFQQRFPEAATSGGDMLLRIFFFYSFFLPMNARYSVDAAAGEFSHKENEFYSIFTATWIIQIILLYVMTFLFKWAPVYHTTFEAVWYMLQLDIFTTDFGRWLGQHYMATKVLSFASYALELIGPLLLLIPFKREIFRGTAVISFWLFHLGIGATMHLGNFVPICLIIWVAMVPTAWWDYVTKKFIATSELMGILYYNAESEFARKFGFVAKELLFLNLTVVPGPSSLIKGTRLFALEDGKQKIILGPGIVGSILQTSRIGVIKTIGKALNSDLGMYLSEVKEAGQVGTNNKNITVPSEKTTQSKSLEMLRMMFETIGFSKVKIQLNKFERFLGGFLVTLVVAWNIEGYVDDRKWYIGSPFDEIMFALQLNQGWAMFAPHPQRGEGWWVMEGKLGNGKDWDALNDKMVSFDRPESFFATYASDDWMKFLDNLSGTKDENYLQLLGRHLCRRWNEKNSEGNVLKNFKLHYMQEWTNPHPNPASAIRKQTLWNHKCF